MQEHQNNFFKYIKAVGTGPKGNRDLSRDEARDMMQQILSGSVSSELITAFLLGWRLKPETSEEFLGALLAIEEQSKTTPIKNSIELGYPFDGKAKTPYLLPQISTILQNSDLNLVLLGDAPQPVKGGLTIQELFKENDFAQNTHYLDRSDYCPVLHNLTQLRMHLGLRTAFNTLEKLPNISQSDFAITGVHHKPYVKKYQDIFASKYRRFAVIQGSEGTPELLKKGMLWLCENGETTEYLIDPSDFSIEKDDEEGLAKLNGAILLFVADKFTSIQEAFVSLS